MILKVYSVYDHQIESFARPFFMQSKGEAIRGWIQVVNDPGTQINKTPQDFILFELGEYDDQTGMFSQPKAPVPIAPALEYIKKQDIK